MTVLNYIARQRERISKRHEGETFLLGREGEDFRLETRTALDILKELNAVEGLNVREREAARTAVFA